MGYNNNFDLHGKVISASFQKLTLYDTSSGTWYNGTGSSFIASASYAVQSDTASFYPFGIVEVIHADGTHDEYFPDANSDYGRGDALLNAFNDVISGDSVFLSANVFDIGNNYINLSGDNNGNVALIGAGKYLTEIKSIFSGPIVYMTSGSLVSDLGITEAIIPVVPSTAQAPITTNETSHNAIIRNVYLKGNSDGIVCSSGNSSPVGTTKIYIYDTTIETLWDDINISGEVTELQINCYDCDFTTDGSQNNAGRCITGNNNTINLYNCNVTVTGNPTTGLGLNTEGTAIINCYGGVINTPLNGLDISNESGTINITSNTSFNVNKTLGNITYLNADATVNAIGQSENVTIFQGGFTSESDSNCEGLFTTAQFEIDGLFQDAYGSQGTNGQVLTISGTMPYWSNTSRYTVNIPLTSSTLYSASCPFVPYNVSLWLVCKNNDTLTNYSSGTFTEINSCLSIPTSYNANNSFGYYTSGSIIYVNTSNSPFSSNNWYMIPRTGSLVVTMNSASMANFQLQIRAQQ